MPESADVDTTIEQLKNDMERLANQKTRAILSTLRQESNARFARVEAKIKGNTNAFEAMPTRIDSRIDALENNNSSSSSGIHKGSEQNPVGAVATGFTESSTVGEEVREFLSQRTFGGGSP